MELHREVMQGRTIMGLRRDAGAPLLKEVMGQGVLGETETCRTVPTEWRCKWPGKGAIATYGRELGPCL